MKKTAFLFINQAYRISLYLFIFMFTYFVLFPIPICAELTASNIASKYGTSVITIITFDKNDQQLSFGSGFFINNKGDIATNYHVLEGSSKAKVKTKKGEEGRILEIIKSNPELDLVIARTSLKNTFPVHLGNSELITTGEDIVVIGNPVGLEGTISKGIISGIRDSEGIKIIQITAPISPGSSGGPVFNLSGKVIGITTANINIGQNLNFAMPSNYLTSLKSVGIKYGSLPTVPVKERTSNLISSMPKEERWRFYLEDQKNNYFFDRASILIKNKVVKVWTKLIPKNLEQSRMENIEFAKEFKRKFGGDLVDYSSYAYMLTLEEVDCYNRKIAFIQFVSFDSNDDIITVTNSSAPYTWTDILPEGKNEKFYDIMCQ